MPSLDELSAPQATRAVPELEAKFALKDAPTGWHPVPGYPKWQVVPDVAHPWDPEVVRAMRTIDPAIVPLWVLWAYKPPKDDANKDVFVTGRHAIGWHVPQYEAQDFGVLMPTLPINGLVFKRPTRLWKIYHEREETSERIGGFVPFSWWMYYNLLDEFRPCGAPTMREYIVGKKAAEQVKKVSIQAQHDYMNAQMAPFIQKKLDQVSPTDWKAWQAGGWRTARPKKLQLDLGR